MRAFLLVLSGIYNFIVSVISGLCFAFSLDYMKSKEWPFPLLENSPIQTNTTFIAVFAVIIPILVNLLIAFSYILITKKLADSGAVIEKIKLKHYLIVNGIIYLLVIVFCILLGTSSY